MVPRRGLEPPRLSALVPETSASTNSATWALARRQIRVALSPCQIGAAEACSSLASPHRGPVQRGTDPVFAAANAPPHQPIRSARHDRQIPPSTRWSPSSAARASSAATWCGRLAKRGYRIRVAVRRPDLAGHLQPLGRVGQIHAVQANLRYAGFGRGRRARRRRRGQPGRHPVRARPPALRRRAGLRRRAVALAAARHGARLVHVSAIGADENSPSPYARTKAQGEKLRARGACRSAVIMRPSIVFGPEDDFFNRFAAHGAHLAGAAADRRRRRRGSSRSSSATSPRRSPRAVDGQRARPARSTSSAARRCTRSRS